MSSSTTFPRVTSGSKTTTPTPNTSLLPNLHPQKLLSFDKTIEGIIQRVIQDAAVWQREGFLPISYEVVLLKNACLSQKEIPLETLEIQVHIIAKGVLDTFHYRSSHLHQALVHSVIDEAFLLLYFEKNPKSFFSCNLL